VSAPDQEAARHHGVEATFFMVDVNRQILAEIAALIDGGGLETRVGAILPLEDAREAHFMLERLQAPPRRVLSCAW